MKKYIDSQTGRLIVEVEDLSPLYERFGYNWFQRHLFHRRHKKNLRKADVVIVPDEKVRAQVVRYYFVPKDRIVVKDSCLRRNDMPEPQE